MTIDIARVRAVKTVYCHRNGPTSPCADGVASALLIRSALPDAKVVFVEYGSTLAQLYPHPHALFCDICPEEADAEEWIGQGAIVLDHHRSREGCVRAFAREGQGVFGDAPGVSGAMLAFRHVWVPLQTDRGPVHDAALRFAVLVGVRDTWQRQSPDWESACRLTEALRFWPWGMWPVDAYASYAGIEGVHPAMGEMLPIGNVLYAKSREQVAANVRRARWFLSRRGTAIAIVPTLSVSDVSDYLVEADVVVGFGFDTDDDAVLRVSVRSRNDFDCAAFARSRGGGGHLHAAGFACPYPFEAMNPYALIMAAIDNWENR